MEKLPNKNDKEDFDWKPYYEQVAGEKHSRSLEQAVTNYCKEKEEALDIGAGNLRDTKYLLREGFRVTAIDPSPVSLEEAEKLHTSSLILINDKLGAFHFPENQFDVVNAQSILFHFSSVRFFLILENIKKSLKKEGVFVGDFLGDNDEWNREGSQKTFNTKTELLQLFKDFNIKLLEEKEEDAPYAHALIEGTGKVKHWHWIKLIAVKK